jgi:hypothetical protein
MTGKITHANESLYVVRFDSGTVRGELTIAQDPFILRRVGDEIHLEPNAFNVTEVSVA